MKPLLTKLFPYLPGLLTTLILFLTFLPLSAFAIFLGGDSCCGEDTSSNMLVVATIMTGILLMVVPIINIIIKVIAQILFHKEYGWRFILYNSMISSAIIGTFIWLYTISLIKSSFG